jgi:radical SAM superfamily enzyme YgiQ (UPF0313 family)
MKILLVYPMYPDTFWSFKYALKFISKKASLPPLGLLTVAAMLPADWEQRLVDMNTQHLTDADLRWADYVMLSAMTIQRESVNSVITRCKALGVKMIAGGPLFTANPDEFIDVDHLILNEAEITLPLFLDDLRKGKAGHVYSSPQWADLSKTPQPRFDLLNMKAYASMSIQYSRGCPFDCDFCNITVLYGRVPRTKTREQILAELDTLYARGWRNGVFIVDDNFIGNKKRVRELLRELVEWRAKVRPAMGFLTEASVNLADQDDLLDLMGQAGFKKVFVGLETPITASLHECDKVQNGKRDLKDAVRIIQASGLQVMGGFIVGFDNDPPDVFRHQFDFIQGAGVVTAMVGLLTALPQTRLYERLARDGRMLAESLGNNTAAALNFVPRLDRDGLLEGYRDLMRSLYAPENYYRRARAFLSTWRPRGPRMRLSGADLRAFLRSLWTLGLRQRGRRAYWRFFWVTLLREPRKFHAAMELAIMGHHFRTLADRL